MNESSNKPTSAEHVSMCKQNPEQSGLGWKIQASSDKTAGFSRRGRGSTTKGREELTVITCHHIAIILCLYILLYIDYHILSLYLKIYISLTHPPCSLTVRPSYSCICRLLRCQTLWVWLPAMKTMVALAAEAESHRGEFPYQHAWVPIDVFWGVGFQEKNNKNQQQTCWQKTQLTQDILYLKKAWKEPYLKLKQWSCDIDPQSDLLIHFWWSYIFKWINGKKNTSETNLQGRFQRLQKGIVNREFDMTQPLSWVKTYEILVLGKWLDPDVMAYQNSTSQNSQSGLFTLKKLESLGSKYVYVYIYIYPVNTSYILCLDM